MKVLKCAIGIWALGCLLGVGGCRKTQDPSAGSDPLREGSLHPVLFHEVRLVDTFWKPRLKILADSLVPYAMEKTVPAVENLRRTGNFLKGDTTNLPFPHRYISSDLYKVMEGAARSLMENPNPQLEQKLDEIITLIGAAQKPDGYLYVAHTTGVSRDHEHWGGAGMGDRPYSYVLHSHELYNMGHMYEAAIAYYRATGKDTWLKIAEKNAQHINKVFFEGDPNYNDGKPVNQAPGHQELELALVKLYHATGKRLYLDMAKRFLDIRGKTYIPEGEGVMSKAYAQQHLPVADQRRPVGHAVRAAYMYAAMADVAALTDAGEYDMALNSIWQNLVDTRMHITGGLGAVHGIEGFGAEYELPNKEAYNETCAAVGNVLLNHRLFLRHRDAKYMDIAEVALFNNTLAGMNLSGNRFFYVNPLEADGTTPFNQGRAGRSSWFNTACCPSNLARLLPQVSGMMYAHTADELYVSLYAGNQAEIPLKEGKVRLHQQTNYPFNGTISLRLTPEKEQAFSLKLRIPTWTGAQFVPGGLYRYALPGRQDISLSRNGKPVAYTMEKGFATISATWKPGDQVVLRLPMPVRFSKAIDQVLANRNRRAVTRGPLVYCAEGVDHGGTIGQFYLGGIPAARDITLSTPGDGVLKGIPAISFPAKVAGSKTGIPGKMTLIPYYAWNNRGDTPMRVWFPESGSSP